MVRFIIKIITIVVILVFLSKAYSSVSVIEGHLHNKVINIIKKIIYSEENNNSNKKSFFVSKKLKPIKQKIIEETKYKKVKEVIINFLLKTQQICKELKQGFYNVKKFLNAKISPLIR